jgi:hypothetical protein
LTPELFQVNAMLGGLLTPDVNHWDVATEALRQCAVAFDVYLAKRCVEFT